MRFIEKTLFLAIISRMLTILLVQMESVCRSNFNLFFGSILSIRILSNLEVITKTIFFEKLQNAQPCKQSSAHTHNYTYRQINVESRNCIESSIIEKLLQSNNTTQPLLIITTVNCNILTIQKPHLFIFDNKC